MQKISISILECTSESIIAENVYSPQGALLVPKGSPINDYIKKKLSSFSIDMVKCYDCTGVEGEEEVEEAEEFDPKDEKLLSEGYSKSINEFKEIVEEFKKGGNINERKLNSIGETIIESLKFSARMIVQRLYTLKAADPYTYIHSVNVSIYAMLCAIWMGLEQEEVVKVVKAGILHDIGKASIPSYILNKPEILTEEELQEIKKHTIYGYNSLRNVQSIDYQIKQAVLMHHERMDGSGYPLGVMGNRLNIYTRIISVADVYDAMTTNRSYKKKMSPFEAINELLSLSISALDVNIVNVFTRKLSSSFVGSPVRLNNGKKGKIVYVPSFNIIAPIVQVDDNYIDFSKSGSTKILELM